MVNYNLTPSQLLLMIFAIELISGIVLSVIASTIINGYFRAKEQHIGRIAKALGETLTKMATNGTAKKKEDKNESDQ